MEVLIRLVCLYYFKACLLCLQNVLKLYGVSVVALTLFASYLIISASSLDFSWRLKMSTCSPPGFLLNVGGSLKGSITPFCLAGYRTSLVIMCYWLQRPLQQFTNVSAVRQLLKDYKTVECNLCPVFLSLFADCWQCVSVKVASILYMCGLSFYLFGPDDEQ